MPDRKWPVAVLAIGLAAMTACTPRHIDVAACPPVIEYSREFQARLAAEVSALAPETAIIEALKDYAATRDQLRACRA